MEQLKEVFEQSEITKTDLKAQVFVNWLKKEFGLGRGHSMAVWALFVSKVWIVTKHTKMGTKKHTK